MGSMLPYIAASWILWVMNIAPVAGENSPAPKADRKSSDLERPCWGYGGFPLSWRYTRYPPASSCHGWPSSCHGDDWGTPMTSHDLGNLHHDLPQEHTPASNNHDERWWWFSTCVGMAKSLTFGTRRPRMCFREWSITAPKMVDIFQRCSVLISWGTSFFSRAKNCPGTSLGLHPPSSRRERSRWSFRNWSRRRRRKMPAWSPSLARNSMSVVLGICASHGGDRNIFFLFSWFQNGPKGLDTVDLPWKIHFHKSGFEARFQPVTQSHLHWLLVPPSCLNGVFPSWIRWMQCEICWMTRWKRCMAS